MNISGRIGFFRDKYQITYPRLVSEKKDNILLIETADACGGGAAGDSVNTLKDLITHAPDVKSLVHVVDPKAADHLSKLNILDKGWKGEVAGDTRGYGKKEIKKDLRSQEYPFYTRPKKKKKADKKLPEIFEYNKPLS